MAHTIPDSGRNWFADRAVTESNEEYINVIAVGTGTDTVRSSDEQLSNEVYRASRESPNIEIERTSNTGEIKCTISITGGTEVDVDSEVTEFGLVSSDGVLLYRELRSNAVTVESGDTKIFEFRVTVTE